MKRNCQTCRKELFGRKDKKYCSDQCRTEYNNNQNSDQNNFMRNVNNILRKNRRILSKLNPTGKTKVKRDKLLAQGFNFQYITNQYKTKAGKIYQFCYEHGYLELDGDIIMLVVRQEYVD